MARHGLRCRLAVAEMAGTLLDRDLPAVGSNTEATTMRMRSAIGVILSGLLLGGAAVAAAKPSDKPVQKRAKHQRAENGRDDRVNISVSFSTGEVRLIREHYAPRYRNLPPGLQKKLARTGKLPPGWQKKLEPFPVVLERRLVVLPTGYARGVLDGHAVIYNPRTQIIVDIAALF